MKFPENNNAAARTDTIASFWQGTFRYGVAEAGRCRRAGATATGAVGVDLLTMSTSSIGVRTDDRLRSRRPLLRSQKRSTVRTACIWGQMTRSAPHDDGEYRPTMHARRQILLTVGIPRPAPFASGEPPPLHTALPCAGEIHARRTGRTPACGIRAGRN
jgi:hypothetical protein